MSCRGSAKERYHAGCQLEDAAAGQDRGGSAGLGAGYVVVVGAGACGSTLLDGTYSVALAARGCSGARVRRIVECSVLDGVRPLSQVEAGFEAHGTGKGARHDGTVSSGGRNHHAGRDMESGLGSAGCCEMEWSNWPHFSQHPCFIYAN